VKPELKAPLKALVREWAEEPAKFFKTWSLQPEIVQQISSEIEPGSNGLASQFNDPATEVLDPEVPAVEDGNAEPEPFLNILAGVRLQLRSVLDGKVAQIRETLSRKHADCICWIFHTLFFRDFLMLFTSRELESDEILPKGSTLKKLATEVLTLLSADVQLVDDLVSWVKAGQLYHLVGLILGEGSWFVLRILSQWRGEKIPGQFMKRQN
jgi:hypothetical protein